MSYLDIYRRLPDTNIVNRATRASPSITFRVDSPSIYRHIALLAEETITMVVRQTYSWTLACFTPDYILIFIPVEIQVRPRFWLHKVNTALLYGGVPPTRASNSWFYKDAGRVYYHLPTTESIGVARISPNAYRSGYMDTHQSVAIARNVGQRNTTMPCQSAVRCQLAISYDASCSYTNMNRVTRCNGRKVLINNLQGDDFNDEI